MPLIEITHDGISHPTFMPDHWGPIKEGNDLLAIDCLECGYVHLAPIPSQEKLDAFYEDFYANGKFVLEQNPRDRWYWRMIYHMRLDKFRELLEDFNPFPLVLDYGAGTGQFVRAALDWPWVTGVVGYEPNADAAAHMNSIHTSMMRFKFSAVHCSMVLEHVRDPRRELKKIHDHMPVGGVLCVCVPNEFNRLQDELARRFDYSPLHEAHVNYFTPLRLNHLLWKAGFGVLEQWGTFPMEWFALNGVNYVENPRMGHNAHVVRMLFEWAAHKVGKLEELRRKWGSQNIGREVVLWARKRDEATR